MCKSEFKLDEKGIGTLYVDGKPFFMHSGEIHNSSASTLQEMEEKIWPQVRELNLNSLIVPIYWECIEKEEGKYDFTLIDGIIKQARKECKKLMFLWFGLWKNAESMYVPAWMKKDSQKYFLAEKVNGDKINTISPLCQDAIAADKKADILSLEAGHIEKGQFISDKRLNGDEKMALRFGSMPGVFMLELYKY